MDLECELRFEILKGNVLVKHSKKVVGIEKGMVVVVGKGIVVSHRRKTLCTYKKKITKIRTSKLN